jgi:hypothetical protein
MENNNNKNLSSVSLLEDDQGSRLNVPVIQAGASNVSVSLLEGKVRRKDSKFLQSSLKLQSAVVVYQDQFTRNVVPRYRG